MNRKRSGGVMQRIRAHHGKLTALTFTPDGRQLVSGGSDGCVRIWSLGALAIVRAIAAHEGAVSSLEVDPGGARLLTSGADGMVRLWSLPDGTAELAFAAHERSLVRSLHSPTDEIVATVDEAVCIRTWDAEAGQRLAEMQGIGTPPFVGFLPTGALVVTASHGRILTVDARTGETLHEVLAPEGKADALAVSPAHEALLVAAGTTLRLIDSRSGEVYRAWQLDAPPAALAVSGDGALALAAWPGRLAGLDVETGTERILLTLPKGRIGAIAASPTGEAVAAGLARGEIGLWGGLGARAGLAG